MTYDAYEERIMHLLRQDHTKTYTVEQIRLAVVGSNLSWIQKGYTPLDADYAYREMDDALCRLVQRDEAYEKKNDSGKSVYGIRISRVKRAKIRIDRSRARRSVRRSGMSLDRRVKGIHRNWLAIGGIVVGAIIAIIAIIIQRLGS